jgi:hypothetical protein
MRGGRIEAVEGLGRVSDGEVMTKAPELFESASTFRRLQVVGSHARAYPASRARHPKRRRNLAPS